MSTTTKPTPAAMRAAEAVAVYYEDSFYDPNNAALAIDRETGLPELVEALEVLAADNAQRAKVGKDVNWAAIHAAWEALAKARGEPTLT